MDKNEVQWDRLLKIKTSGRDDSAADRFRYPYEPTPYCVLERLVNSGYIRKENVLLDYGCGKGRVDFFVSYHTRCSSIGIEYDERIFNGARENGKTAVSGARVSFVHARAENFAVSENVDRIYFFNPFSVEILKKVIRRIMDSFYEMQRNVLLFFYYPSEEYISCLMNMNELSFVEEIDCRDLFDGKDIREKIMILKIDG